MTGEDRLPIAEIPAHHRQAFLDTDYTSADMKATMEAFGTVSDAIPFNWILGVRGIILATRIRVHDFGEAETASGRRIEDRKQDPMWLGAEVDSLMKHLDVEQA